ncbi:MAG: hypothetical protein Q4B35_06580 [Slackia sp.]|nr:hypothetical protein [Slackia sp.]
MTRECVPVTRCRECTHCREFPQGSVCTVRGAAGWFAADPEGYCSLAVRRDGPLEPAASGKHRHERNEDD